MRFEEALRFPGTHACVNSLKHVEGLDDFEVVLALPKEVPSLQRVVQDYIALLRATESRLEEEARERAGKRMPPRLAESMLRQELDPSFYASFRAHGEWVLEDIRTFATGIRPVSNAWTSKSAVERLKFGLSKHCEESVTSIEACIEEIRRDNAFASHSDEVFDERDCIAKGYHRWRLPATTVVTGLIEIGRLQLSSEDKGAIWNGLSSDDSLWVLGDIDLRPRA